MQHHLSALLCLAVTSTASSAQLDPWHAVPFNPAMPAPIAEGHLLLYDNGSQLSAYSPAPRKWLGIAASGTTIVGTGDWTALLKVDPVVFRGYSSRFHDFSDLVLFASANVVASGVEDGVAWVHTQDQVNNVYTIHAYSSSNNTWSNLNYIPGQFPTTVASSRFVVGIQDAVGVHGFSDRTGTWSSLAGVVVAPLQADGNVLATEVLDSTGALHAAAFSGVLGGPFALSGALSASGAASLTVDHNVAYVETPSNIGGVFSNGYSAYNGFWSQSTISGPVPATLHMRDNLVLVERTTLLTTRYEAYGARPGTWRSAPGAGLTPTLVVGVEEDCLVLVRNNQLLGFSGVCSGTFVTQPVTPLVLWVSAGAHLAMVEDAVGDLFAFAPATSTWATPLALGFGAPMIGEDTVAMVDDAGLLLGYSGRHNVWTGGPTLGTPVTLLGTDSSFAVHDAATGDLYLYNERCDGWEGPIAVGPNPTVMGVNEALLFQDSGGAVYGFGVQHGDVWPNPSPGPFGAMGVEENVAWVEDGAKMYGFSSYDELHAWRQWPNGTEYQTLAGNGGATSLDVGLYGQAINAGNPAYLLYQFAPNCPGVPIAGILGRYLLAGAPLSIAMPNIGVRGLSIMKQPLPAGGPICLQLWSQGLYLDGVNLAFTMPQPEPTWIF